jgi:hypothetical protein
MRFKTQISEHLVLHALRIVFFLVVASLCERGHAVTVVDPYPYPTPLLSLSVHGVKKAYGKTDSVELRLVLKNESASNIYVLGLWATSASIVLQDHAAGADVSTSFIPLLLPPPPRSARDFLKINPGGYVEGKVGLSLSDYELEAGHRYDLVVQYRGTVPKKMGFGLNLYSSEMPAIVAPPVSIEIASH